MVLLKSKEILKIGQQAPSFELIGVDSKAYALADFKGKSVLVIFMCNHCPYVIPQIPTIKKIAEKYKEKIVVIGINSNDARKYPDDSYDNMILFAEKNKLNFPYLYDDTQEIAKAWGAQCTPDPFLIDKKGKLAWHGRLNNALNPGEKATQQDMDEAITELLSTGKVTKEFLPSQGCSIKWK
ncbi:thioredoxin family protein [Candidatus Woesearchaeota archaeon]|nr:thioredoxin family protein [Candidatus Woesearchaeota archaeon]